MIARWTTATGGLLFLGLGLFFVTGALDLDLGTARRMGPGYFPLMLGALVSVLAAAVIVQAFLRRDENGRPDLRSFAAVSAGVLAFAMVTPNFGMIPAAFLSVLVSSFADSRMGFAEKFLLAVGVAGAVWVIFILALQLPFETFRTP
jgi:hypothetical protein